RDIPVDASPEDIRRIALVDLIPYVNEQRKISTLPEKMNAFDVITEKLQRDDVTVTAIRDIVDIVLD
ncbi:hypothetical protein L914_10126, partial [Phytophthora nicotianae]